MNQIIITIKDNKDKKSCNVQLKPKYQDITKSSKSLISTTNYIYDEISKALKNLNNIVK